jgi:hypothetical protein
MYGDLVYVFSFAKSYLEQVIFSGILVIGYSYERIAFYFFAELQDLQCGSFGTTETMKIGKMYAVV